MLRPGNRVGMGTTQPRSTPPGQREFGVYVFLLGLR